jgi:hypothetical protein
VFYKLVGLVTWKAIKFYVGRKVPTRAIAIGTVVAGIAAVSVVAAWQQTADFVRLVGRAMRFAFTLAG